MDVAARPDPKADARPEPVVKAHDRVYRALRTRILHGEIAPGAGLTLRGLGQEFGLSMTPVREAVQRLVAEGALSLSLSGRVSAPSLTDDRIEELATIRALLEPELASRALPRVHFALLERLDGINQAVGQAAARGDASGYLRHNLDFHRTLYLRARSPAILQLAETVWLQMGPTMAALYARLDRRAPPQYHRVILSALRAGDVPGLRLAIRTDVTQGLRMLKG